MTDKATMRDPRLAQIDECLELARAADLVGDKVTFIAATVLAAQIVQLLKIERGMFSLAATPITAGQGDGNDPASR